MPSKRELQTENADLVEALERALDALDDGAALKSRPPRRADSCRPPRRISEGALCDH